MKTFRLGTLLTLAVLAAAGCASTKAAKKTAANPSGDASGAEAAAGKETAVTEVNIRGAEFGATPNLATIYFDYDRYALSDAARTSLATNAEFLKKNADFDVLVEGNCDERGTIEYNLALGQKRAQTVRDYYTRLGVPGKQLGTLSYGKEKPTCAEATEVCWAKNRRAETKVRSRTVSTPRTHVEEAPPK
jgi:peptidoglycan-associated lipoprotein